MNKRCWRRKSERNAGGTCSGRCAAILLSLLLVLLGCGGGEGTSKPNIVLLVIDTIRPDHLSVYGYAHDTSPFLAELARKGTTFENTYSASSWTSPAMASLMTSTYPFQNGVVLNLHSIDLIQKQKVEIEINRIPEEVETLSEMLQRAGYRTFGLSDNINVSARMGFDAGFDRFQTENYIGAAGLSDIAREWGGELHDGDSPFFLYLHYMDPHAPYKRHRRLPWFDQFVEDRSDVSAADAEKPLRMVKGQRTPVLEVAYDAEIRYLDEELRKLFIDLDILDNTLIIVVGDHGEEFWEHGKSGHSHSLYDELLRVPFFLYGPGSGVPQGLEVGGDAALLDIVPTVAGRIGIEPHRSVQGKNLWPVIRKKKSVERRTLFAHLVRKKEEIPGSKDVTLFGVITPESKLIHSTLAPPKLFDRSSDPLEKNNLATGGQRTVDSLIALFDLIQKAGPLFEAESTAVTLDSAEIEHLRALGYIN